MRLGNRHSLYTLLAAVSVLEAKLAGAGSKLLGRRNLESSFSRSAGHALVQLRVISSLSSKVLTVLNFPRDTNPQGRDRLDILLHY